MRILFFCFITNYLINCHLSLISLHAISSSFLQHLLAVDDIDVCGQAVEGGYLRAYLVAIEVIDIERLCGG